MGKLAGHLKSPSFYSWAPIDHVLHSLMMDSLSQHFLNDFKNYSWSRPLPPFWTLGTEYKATQTKNSDLIRLLSAALNKWPPLWYIIKSPVLGRKFLDGQKVVDPLYKLWTGASFEQYGWCRIVSLIALIPSMRIIFALFFQSFWCSEGKKSQCFVRIPTACLTFVNLLFQQKHSRPQAHRFTQAKVSRT